MIVIDKNICPHNHKCPLIDICPVKAISQDSEGYPIIDYSLCIECGKCINNCPMKALKHTTIQTEVKHKTSKTMKIAIPTRENMVDDHFGHCDHYTIYTIENKQIINTEVLPSPQGCGCKSGIAADLQNIGVEVMLAGNMGDGAKNKLEAHGIKVIRGCAGPIQIVVGGYLAGAIRDSGQGCSSHNGEHQCGGHNHSHSHNCHHNH